MSLSIHRSSILFNFSISHGEDFAVSACFKHMQYLYDDILYSSALPFSKVVVQCVGITRVVNFFYMCLVILSFSVGWSGLHIIGYTFCIASGIPHIWCCRRVM